MLARLATLLVAGFFLWSGGLQAWDPRHALTLLRVEPDAGASGALMLSLVKARGIALATLGFVALYALLLNSSTLRKVTLRCASVFFFATLHMTRQDLALAVAALGQPVDRVLGVQYVLGGLGVLSAVSSFFAGGGGGGGGGGRDKRD